ncbi:4-alpha-glucanotransferase [Thermodesulfobacteriota bacterium]
MKVRGSGILLHTTSLPSKFGIGDLGSRAYEFTDFLASSKQRYWQILPLNPTDPRHGNSPYHSRSAFACNPLLISPELLFQDGLLEREDLQKAPGFKIGRVDYQAVIAWKDDILQRAYENFKERPNNVEYSGFIKKNASWLKDYALFSVLRHRFNGNIWSDWPDEIRDRRPEALEWAGNEFKDEIERLYFIQYAFSKQWKSLTEYCKNRGVKIIGDLPIYVVYDSSDVWTNPAMFNLDSEKKPLTVSGVPPDYFSDTGQLWGNPVYRWDILKERDYDWWIERIRHNLSLYDIVRIDHFRGFAGYWEIPSQETNAINGRWVEAPAWDFFNRVVSEFEELPIIAEDLGVITPDVVEIRQHFNFPGMKILLFAFGDDFPSNPYLPHNLERNCLLYTGTHDNNTARGWFERETTPEMRKRIFRYIGRKVSPETIHSELIRLAMMSAANTVIFPLQDILGLGEESRMNRPATRDGNWEWRLDPAMLNESVVNELCGVTEIYGRS